MKPRWMSVSKLIVVKLWRYVSLDMPGYMLADSVPERPCRQIRGRGQNHQDRLRLVVGESETDAKRSTIC